MTPTSVPPVRDRRGRPLRDLRLSVTDRCNLRCAYCMPEDDYTWLPRGDLLTFDEIERLVAAFAALGVRKVRLTGGEPLLRRDLDALVARLARQPGIADLALTTNGTLLAAHAAALRAAGLGRVTVSLDTLQPDRHLALTRRANHAAVLDGLAALAAAGFTGTKINAVVVRGTNDDEVADLLDHGWATGAEVRFVEYMDVAGATRWTPRRLVPAAQILDRVSARFGPVTPVDARPSSPARRFAVAGGRTFGIVSSTTAPFCASCDRGRLTADGVWFQCLYAADGTDLRTPLRAGATPAELRALVAERWRGRADQGAVDRLALADARTPVPLPALRRDPHLEMHTRGG